jgi:RyR domain-containing protein
MTDAIDVIAQVCHEANRAYALATGEPLDQVHPSWPQAPEPIRESERRGVYTALDCATPRELHEAWLRSQRANGWTYGPVRDNAAKVHPLLVDYDDMPAVARRKDALFHAIVNALKEA